MFQVRGRIARAPILRQEKTPGGEARSRCYHSGIMKDDEPAEGLSTPVSRRTFLERLGALALSPLMFQGVGVGAGGSGIWADFGGGLRRPRRWPKTPFAEFPHFSETEIFGAGTYHLGDQSLLEEAFENGVRLVATSPQYQEGGAEKAVGWAFKKSPEPVFMITQIPDSVWEDGSRSVALHRQLSFSLDRLQRGNVEAILVRNAEPEQLADPDFRRFAEDVKSSGTVRHIGFSGQSSGLVKSIEAALDDDLCDIVVFAAYMAEFETIPELLPQLRDRGKLLVATMPQEAALWNRMPGWEEEAERRRHEPWSGDWVDAFTRRALVSAVTETPAHNAILNLREPEDVSRVLGR
jgi:aryl-alcohol dehydrogenase-like predicted oxidoreductase